jgi:GntR family transcriptional repressor for pyruvate dehydrogenase complex
MKILASQGLVRVEQGRGTFVNEAGHAPLRQQLELALLRNGHREESTSGDTWDALLDLRFVLELGSAERAAQHISPEELDRMIAANESMRSHPGDAPACSADDYEFHYTLAQATRNPLWPVILGSLHDLLRQYFELSHHGEENGLNTVREHEIILRALAAGNSQEAAAAMRHHLESGVQDLAAARAKHRIPGQEVLTNGTAH